MATIRDVADRAGVSIATVSRVLNGTAIVNAPLRTRVEDAIHVLRYQPSPAARSLRRNRSNIIGLLVPDLQNSFFLRLIQGVEDIAHANGYSVILCNSHEDQRREQHYLEILYAERVAGAILIPTREHLGDALKGFHERRIPLVTVDRRIQDSTIDAVLVDNISGAREASEHLIARGYSRIGIITGPLTITTGRERLEGYHQALLAAGILPNPSFERSGAFKEENGRLFAEELLNLKPSIDALFVTNNLMTWGALKVVFARQIRLPADLALIGYDETPWTALNTLALTSVIQPVYELGSTAAQRLIQRLKASAIQPRQEILLMPTLRIRDSSASQSLQAKL